MAANQHTPWGRRDERGAALVLIAASMIFILGMAGLAIDLSSLYVGRNQAQRSADAAALAGAKAIVDSGYTSDPAGVTAGTATSWAKDRAVTVGNSNLIAGISPGITDADVTVDLSNPKDPRVTVLAGRDSSHSNAMPTFFVKIFGITSANVSATATAEAFNPSGQNQPVGAQCVKPWLLPNCDAANPLPANPNCSGGWYINPSDGSIEHPSVIGTMLTIKPGDPSQTAAPSKYYTAFLPPGGVATQCPSCANGGSGGGGGANSGAIYRQNIQCCNQTIIVCGPNVVQPITAIDGNMVGPTSQGVDCLIHQGSNGTGQDTLNTGVTPFQILAGSATASSTGVAVGTPIFDSDSLVTVPIYDGTALCPGGSCGTTVNVYGFIQMFIKDETNPQGTVEAYIMNISGCGAGGSGGGGGVVPPIIAGGSSIPVRLIHQ